MVALNWHDYLVMVSFMASIAGLVLLCDRNSQPTDDSLRDSFARAYFKRRNPDQDEFYLLDSLLHLCCGAKTSSAGRELAVAESEVEHCAFLLVDCFEHPQFAAATHGCSARRLELFW